MNNESKESKKELKTVKKKSDKENETITFYGAKINVNHFTAMVDEYCESRK